MTSVAPLLGFREFEFDLPKALLLELIATLDAMATTQLSGELTAQLPEVQGVYQLFYNDELVYIGKTDAEAGLRTRLSRHAGKILHRPSLTGTVTFKAVRILVFTAMDLETQLINHYRAAAGVSWNGSGFGSNDPGRERETTNKSPDGFDGNHPIDIDEKIEVPTLRVGETVNVAKALAAIKAVLPYTLRYETKRNAKGKAMRGHPHDDLLAASFTVPSLPHTVRTLMRAISQALGQEWQATGFDSHCILYKETRDYTYGRVI